MVKAGRKPELMVIKSPDLHPTLMRRVGDAAEFVLLAGALAAIWASIAWILIASIFR